jgi:peptidoglycan/xylan/chitin deacetylase (PgdA/CDA1 family)
MDAASPDRLIQELRKLDSAAPSDAGPRLRAWFKTLPSWHQEELLSALEAAVGHAVVADGHGAINAAMNWDQVRALGQAGMSIGSHTVNHQILAAVDPEVVRMELVESRRRLEQETGQPCWLFAYPNGRDVDFTPQDEAAVRDAGYTCAFTQVVGSIGRDSSRFRLPRIPVPDSGDMNVFRSHLSGVRRVLDSVLG